ncbi:hypothetical protein CO082_04555 [Candidatus Peregrinibacteria bacterium CG_4_9_14_0_8_um_filter_44_15]|nr:MAG: hypothetical protein CO082_04555 [Candidatus Peregrinibacteria bacterium CG_4_9_14_0_8_um_filter_44_15]
MNLDSRNTAIDRADDAWEDRPSLTMNDFDEGGLYFSGDIMDVVLEFLDKARPNFAGSIGVDCRVRSLDTWLRVLSDRALVANIADAIHYDFPYFASLIDEQSRIWSDLCREGAEQARLKAYLLALPSEIAIRSLLSLSFDQYVLALQGDKQALCVLDMAVIRDQESTDRCRFAPRLNALNGGQAENALVIGNVVAQSRMDVPSAVVHVLSEHYPGFLTSLGITAAWSEWQIWYRIVGDIHLSLLVVRMLNDLRDSADDSISHSVIDMIHDCTKILLHMSSPACPDELRECNMTVVLSWTWAEYMSVVEGCNPALVALATRRSTVRW